MQDNRPIDEEVQTALAAWHGTAVKNGDERPAMRNAIASVDALRAEQAVAWIVTNPDKGNTILWTRNRGSAEDCAANYPGSILTPLFASPVQAKPVEWASLFDEYGDHHERCDLAQPSCSCGMRQKYRAALSQVDPSPAPAVDPAVFATDDELDRIVSGIMAEHPDKVEQAKAKPTLAGWFVGQVMKAVDGAADESKVRNVVNAYLSPAPVTEPVTISVQDPILLIAGIKQFGLAPDGSDLRDLEAAVASLQDKVMELIRVGAGMANILYNLAQTSFATPDLRKIMKGAQEEWDKARSATSEDRHALQQGGDR